MNPRILIVVTASLLLAGTVIISAGLSPKTNNALAQMMQPGMMGMGSGMMW